MSLTITSALTCAMSMRARAEQVFFLIFYGLEKQKEKVMTNWGVNSFPLSSALHAMDLEYLEHSSEKEINDLVISVKQIILGKHLHI